MAAPTLQEGSTFSEGLLILDWDQEISLVTPMTAQVTLKVDEREIEESFTGSSLAVDGTSTVLSVPFTIYSGETITVDIEADFVENLSMEGNEAVSDESILNRAEEIYGSLKPWYL